jgi:hypothetical protein
VIDDLTYEMRLLNDCDKLVERAQILASKLKKKQSVRKEALVMRELAENIVENAFGKDGEHHD